MNLVLKTLGCAFDLPSVPPPPGTSTEACFCFTPVKSNARVGAVSWWHLSKGIKTVRDFPGSSVAQTSELPVEGAQVQSLARELDPTCHRSSRATAKDPASWDFPGSSVVKNSPCNAGDLSSILRLCASTAQRAGSIPRQL